MIQLPRRFKLIFRAISGSHLYGTATKDSDIDERGVFVPAEEYFYGFMHKTAQYEDKNNDITYFEIRKFLSLALDSNPNIIELLFVPVDKWLEATNEWEWVIHRRGCFLSKKAKHTFLGYAYSQLHRIKQHRSWLLNPPKELPNRKKFGLPVERSLISKDQIGAFNELVAVYLEQIKAQHPLKEQLCEMQKTYDFKTVVQQSNIIPKEILNKIITVDDSFMDALQREKAYLQAKGEWDRYQSWKCNRNPDRAKLEEKFGYDTKHASHLRRLVSEGEELLSTGFITLPRPDADLILDIRNGKWSYEKLIDELVDFEQLFEKLYETSKLPYSPNRKEVDKLCIDIVKSALFG